MQDDRKLQEIVIYRTLYISSLKLIKFCQHLLLVNITILLIDVIKVILGSAGKS